MAERTTVNQVAQFGKETTPGTAVAAGKKLPSLQITTTPTPETNKLMAAGAKFPTLTTLGKNWTAAKFSMEPPTYDEITYLLSSLLTVVSPSTVGVSGRSWAITPSSTADDTPATFTVEQGSSVRAHKFAYGLVTDLTIKGDRDKVSCSGSMFGQNLTDGITLTASPTVIAQIPVLGQHVDVWIDGTSAGLGTTKLTRVLSWELSIGNRFSPLWVVNSANASFVTHVEQPVAASLKLTLEADSAGMAAGFAAVVAGTRQFARIKATSTLNAGTAIPYSLQFDTCIDVASIGEIRDVDGVYAYDLSADVNHDFTWGKALVATVVNQLATL